ncbi:MAG: hypothetical protein J5761_01230 [Paludibacteraceae bacterium]|nr:hypothetical protein [Paludibacteraceae bacterium]
MKHVYFSLLFVAAITFTGCAHSVYPLDVLYANYNSRMCSPEEVNLKKNVWIYFNEKDIPCPYSIISANTYSPFSLLPFQPVKLKKMNKKFLEQAVKQADKEGGNAILVKGAGYFFVLNMSDRKGVEPPTANFANPILDMTNADLFKSNAPASMKYGERNRTEKAFIDEIESNIDYLQTKEEIAAVRKKLDILSRYNLKQSHPKKAIDKFVRKKSHKVNHVEKQLQKQAAKAKAAASGKKSSSKQSTAKKRK